MGEWWRRKEKSITSFEKDADGFTLFFLNDEKRAVGKSQGTKFQKETARKAAPRGHIGFLYWGKKGKQKFCIPGGKGKKRSLA